ncbi:MULTISPECIES: hypothetical protein [unclassified Enterococcus]|uniref:hypothetical protein n=1 Tax=unclassified Enterococcus TaxID=2608891 RepID=UPI00190356B1|nr:MULTISPECIES: hypothetical protein [unclassified Enterococcus]MBK0036037.1 hypothetical protein [Enterococcus sp. S52]MBK0068695.1 hypothetical protein [Enterococcus sp. S53]MBK0139288.1 hypothetical protein [Enterococcus sp. S76]MBK0142923.1 hypothetical protein [Enterococcus sp. S77]
MNYATIEALEAEKDDLLKSVIRELDSNYEGMKESVRQDILDNVMLYLQMLFDRVSGDDYTDVHFANSIDYQLISQFSSQFNDWYEEHYNANKINELNK